MKNLFNLFIAHIKRITKNLGIIGYFIGMPILIFVLIFIMDRLDSNSSNDVEAERKTSYAIDMSSVGIVINDEGNLWKDFFKKGIYFINDDNGLEKGKDLLQKSKITGLIILGKNFSKTLKQNKKPKLEFIQMHTGNILQVKINALDKSINSYLLNNFVTSNKLINKSKSFYGDNISVLVEKKDGSTIKFALKMMTLIILYAIIFGSTGIVTDLIKFRETKMLTRTLASPNSELSVIISFLFSFVILQVSINMVLFFIFAKIFTLEISGLGLIFITVFTASSFALSLAILFARMFKRVEQLPIVTNLTTLLTVMFFFLAFVSIMSDIIPFPEILKKISILSPLYWLLEILDKEKLFPNLLIIWLMIIALVTGGSYKLKDFNHA